MLPVISSLKVDTAYYAVTLMDLLMPSRQATTGNAKQLLSCSHLCIPHIIILCDSTFSEQLLFLNFIYSRYVKEIIYYVKSKESIYFMANNYRDAIM
jgi:hypothetical protein